MHAKIRACAAALGAAACLTVSGLAVLFGLPRQPPPQAHEAGRERFALLCAGCHGADGKGGEKAPDVVSRAGARWSKQALGELIRRGVPGAGMPPFPLPAAELDELVAYLRAASAPASEQPVPGDAVRGEEFFFGKGGCATCHMVRGRGSASGPDLSGVGAEKSLAELDEALTQPGARIAQNYNVASVRLVDGRTLRGFVRNESNYDLQLQALDGTFRLLRRSDIAAVQRESGSTMPPLAASADEKQNLMAYLSRLAEGARRGGARTVVDAGRAAVGPPLPPGTPEAGPAPGRTSTPGSPNAVPGAVAPDRFAPDRFAPDRFAPDRFAPGDWPSYNGSAGGNRHSGLAGIHRGNVARLAPRWLYSIASAGSLQVTPVVVGGVMYVTSANEAHALDAGTGRLLWQYRRPRTPGLAGDAAGGINRGVAVAGDRIFMVTDHAHLIALHRVTGRLLWETEMADYRQNYGATSAPLVVKDLVVSGHSGGDEGVRGFLAAYRASTGEEVWRFWTVPGPGEPGSETWSPAALAHGCAATWLTGTYDAEANLLYWTTGNPCPDYNGDERGGDNLYSDAVLALDPDTGKLRWHYQHTPHDLFDWDSVQTPVLVDTVFNGAKRRLLLQANRNGFFYVLDRITGALLLARPFVEKLTWATGIGPDGRPRLVPGMAPTGTGVTVCPAVEGATNWMSAAFNPETRLYYVMALEKCNVFTKAPAQWEPGKSYYGGGARAPEPGRKVLRALDVETGKTVWEYPQIGAARSWGGVLSTAAGLVFFGDDSGAFTAVDARSGKLLWHFPTNANWKASPMTYEADGRQFVAIASGPNILAFAVP